MAASAGKVLLIPKGTYDSATTYNMLNVVYYNGATYVCKQTSLGNLPTDTDYWQLMASSSGTAAQVSFDPTGTDMISTNVQNAVVEVKNNISNPNLLINPWFTVNQRGFTTKTVSSSDSDAYCLCRWKYHINLGDSHTGYITATSNGIKIGHSKTPSGSAMQELCIRQYFDGDPYKLTGKNLTLSILLSNGDILKKTITVPSNAIGRFYHDEKINNTPIYLNVLYDNRDSSSNKMFSFGIETKTSEYTSGEIELEIRALKLELGTISTLALDTAPDYTTELLKCQRYFRQINGNNDAIAIGVSQISNCLFIINSVPMRVSNPTVTATGTWKVSVLGTDYSTTSIFRTGSTSTSGIIQIAANYSGSSSHAGQSANLFSSGSASIQIDAEL